MKPDHSRTVGVSKVAGDGVLDHCLEVGPILTLSENRVAKGAGIIATLYSFGYFKNYFA